MNVTEEPSSRLVRGLRSAALQVRMNSGSGCEIAGLIPQLILLFFTGAVYTEQRQGWSCKLDGDLCTELNPSELRTPNSQEVWWQVALLGCQVVYGQEHRAVDGGGWEMGVSVAWGNMSRGQNC